MEREARFRAAGLLGRGLLTGLFATTRWRIEGADHYLRFRREGHPVIFVCWHGHLLPLLHLHRREGIVVLVSEHADGEYVTRILEGHGFGTVRGSSTRGAVRGLKALVRSARAGCDLAVTPDGPRGPARRFKPGALMAARATGLPLIPVAVRATAAWRLRSWDRFLVPRPLSTVWVAYGPPQWIDRSAGQEALAWHAVRMEALLEGLGEKTAAALEVP